MAPPASLPLDALRDRTVATIQELHSSLPAIKERMVNAHAVQDRQRTRLNDVRKSYFTPQSKSSNSCPRRALSSFRGVAAKIRWISVRSFAISLPFHSLCVQSHPFRVTSAICRLISAAFAAIFASESSIRRIAPLGSPLFRRYSPSGRNAIAFCVHCGFLLRRYRIWIPNASRTESFPHNTIPIRSPAGNTRWVPALSRVVGRDMSPLNWSHRFSGFHSSFSVPVSHHSTSCAAAFPTLPTTIHANCSLSPEAPRSWLLSNHASTSGSSSALACASRQACSVSRSARCLIASRASIHVAAVRPSVPIATSHVPTTIQMLICPVPRSFPTRYLGHFRLPWEFLCSGSDFFSRSRPRSAGFGLRP